MWTPRDVTYGDPAKPISDERAAADGDAAQGHLVRAPHLRHRPRPGQRRQLRRVLRARRTPSPPAPPPTPQKIWRTDCATTAAPNQQGTYQYSRAGWCPGADVKPWTFDVTADLGGAATVTFAYDVDAYENTCRPDAMPCAGCTLGAACAYDGGNHTEPNYQHLDGPDRLRVKGGGALSGPSPFRPRRAGGSRSWRRTRAGPRGRRRRCRGARSRARARRARLVRTSRSVSR